MVQKQTNQYAESFTQSAQRPEKTASGSRFLAQPSQQTNKLVQNFTDKAEKLKTQEVAFVTRAKPQSLSLTQYLRSPEHIDAQRDFEKAGDALTKANPDMGAKMVAKAMTQIQQSVEAAQISQMRTKPATGMVARR